jgi:hypothetical protein
LAAFGPAQRYLIMKLLLLLFLGTLLTGLFYQPALDLATYLKKNKNDPELKQFRQGLDKAPDEIYQSTDTYYENYHKQGISLNFNNSDTLVAIFVFSPLSEDYAAYRGALPYGLNFTMTRREVEEKFGVPEYTGVLDDTNKSWVVYRNKKFGITYNSPPADTASQIVEITFQPYN